MFKRLFGRIFSNTASSQDRVVHRITTGDVAGRGTSIVSSGNKNVVTVNGKTHVVYGSNVVVRGNAIYVDNELVAGDLSGDVHVKWEGDPASVDCTSLHVTGSVLGNVDATNVTVAGDIEAGEIDATNVTCHGRINARKIDAVNVKGGK